MYRLFKRLVDFLAAFIGILILSPLLLFLSIGLSLANSGSPFFFQKRPGKKEKIFSIIKFKTMNDKKDANGKLLPDQDRLTKIGKIIRKTSLDELPQLFNVLIGNMSLVGPRPLLPQYLPLYSDKQKKRHLVRPGITGWAQINGRNAISWQQKFILDVWYVENQSFFIDLKIIILTLKKVFKSEGINTKGVATTTPFTGNN